MKQKTRNALALIAIVIYIVITMANPDNPMIRYYALLEVFSHETNRTVFCRRVT